MDAFRVRERLIEDYLEHQWPRLSRGTAHSVAHASCGAEGRHSVANSAKILEDSGLAEDLGAYRGLEQAAGSDDLACLNGDMLVILWPGLSLLKVGTTGRGR